MRTARTGQWVVGLAALVAAALAGVLALRDGGEAEPAPRAGDPSGPVAAMLAAADTAGFARLDGPWELSLPADHAAHPEAAMESWTLAAHLAGPDGAQIGLDLSLARFGLAPPDVSPPADAWTPRALHRGHLALVGAEGVRAEERLSRGPAGVAGHDPARGEIRIDHWTLTVGGPEERPRLTLSASLGPERVRLVLAPEKPPLPAGEDGETPFRGFAMTRLSATGEIGPPGAARAVEGTAWLDHLWGELPVPGGPVAYDRLVAHLDDGSDLSLVATRRRDGRGGVAADGVLVAPDGAARALGEDLAIEPLRHWEAPGGARYPVAWRVRGAGLELEVAPLREDQLHRFEAPLWSGLVTVEGRRDGRPVGGTGTLQLTGYADP